MVIQQAKLWPQPTVAVAVSGLALLALVGALLMDGFSTASSGRTLLVLLLALAIVAAYQFPIHLLKSQKIEMTTVALYLIAVLSPSVGVGVLAAGLGLLAAELLVRAKRGNYYSDVATAVGRYMIIILVGATVSRVLSTDHAVGYLITALVLLVLDFLSIPILVSPVTGERVLKVIIASSKRGLPVEGAQYLVGLAGVFAVQFQAWSMLLLLLPTALVYKLFKSILEREPNVMMAQSAVLTADPLILGGIAPAAQVRPDTRRAPVASPSRTIWSDEAIVAGLRRQDQVALQKAVETYGPQLYRFAMYELGDATSAEKVVSAVFAHAQANADGYLYSGVSLRTWLFRCAREVMLSSDNHAAWSAPTGDEYAVIVEDPSLFGGAKAVRTALQQLPDEQRQILVLRLVEHWEPAEIAMLLDRSDAAIRSLQLHALQSMHSSLHSSD